jgi:hypothetical protein
MRREMRSARPFTMNNSGIDAQNGAGVSWPKDDDHERDAAGGVGLELTSRTTGAMATAQTPRFVAFVRALARQAARECFELETKRRSQTTQ